MPNFLLVRGRESVNAPRTLRMDEPDLLNLMKAELYAAEMRSSARPILRLLFRVTGTCVIFSARDMQRRCTQTERSNC